jgi:hypothetical protein
LGLVLSDIFLICDVCAVVDTDQERIRFGHPCSACGSASRRGTIYFGLPVSILINLIQEASETRLDCGPTTVRPVTAHEIATVVFFCTLAEVLVEHFLRELMTAQRIPRGAVKLLLEDNLYLRQRVGKLFPALTGYKWKDAIQDLGGQNKALFAEASQFYVRAAAARNSFLHKGNKWAIKSDMRANCLTHAATLVSLFAALHNHFVKDFYGPHRPYLPLASDA